MNKHMKMDKGVTFMDYQFNIDSYGTITFDKEITLEHMKSNIGDLYILMFEDDNVKLVPCDPPIGGHEDQVTLNFK